MSEDGSKQSRDALSPRESVQEESPAKNVEELLGELFRRVAEIRAAAQARLRRVEYGTEFGSRVDEEDRQGLESELGEIAEEERAERALLAIELVAAETEAARLRLEERAESAMSGEEFLEAFERRFKEASGAVPLRMREDAETNVSEMRRLLAERRDGVDAGTVDPNEVESRLREVESRLRRAELSMDGIEAERVLIPSLFRSLDAKGLAAALRDGMGHPRSLTEILTLQFESLGEKQTIPRPSEIIRSGVPEMLRPGYGLLRSDLVPASLRETADRAIQQMLNRFFAEAATRIDRMTELPEAAPVAADLRALAETLREEERIESERIETSFRLQGDLYESIAAEHPERRAELDRRRALEELFVRGEPVGEPESLFPVAGGAGAPHTLTLRLGDRTEKVLVKFGFAERFVRPGVQPGHGHWREVAGAAHAVGFGVDVPAVAARRLEGFGVVTVMELLDGSGCSKERDWFLDDEGSLRPEVGAIALDDYLKGRTDGAPRNIVKTSDGRLASIDHGSDLSADVTEPISSAALYLVSEAGQSVPEHLQQQAAEWAASRGRRVFEGMLSLMPEDMGDFAAAYADRLNRLIQSFLIDKEDARFPEYRDDYRRDFGRTFFEDARDFLLQAENKNKSAVSRSASGADVTVARPRVV